MKTAVQTKTCEVPVFASRMMNMPRSFLGDILKVAQQPGMISLAGGLPNKGMFPVEALREASDKVFRECGADSLQYSNSEGLYELRAYIAAHYKKRGVSGISPDNIMITNGSQQALDLLAKVLVNEGDGVILEEPSYLGAIQALAIFRPKFIPVPLTEEGLEIESLKVAVRQGAKLMYVIPNFQNPSGISYSEENRRQVADIVRGTATYLVEDDPYGELRFSGEMKTSFKTLIPENTILLGTFSKTIVPGFRLGWVVVPDGLMEQLLVAKGAADLHTSSFSQRLFYEYLRSNDTSAHIAKIVAKYALHKEAMAQAITKYFPKSVTQTNPEGGMFLWVTLPAHVSALTFFEQGAKEGVCVVPGHPFYIDKEDVCTARLSFSSVDEATIEEGIRRLGSVAHKLCAE